MDWIQEHGKEVGIGILIATFIGLYAAVLIVEQLAWDEFKVVHNCKIVGQMSGSTTTGIGIAPNGQVATVIGSTPGKTGWLCDDGVTYWR